MERIGDGLDLQEEPHLATITTGAIFNQSFDSLKKTGKGVGGGESGDWGRWWGRRDGGFTYRLGEGDGSWDTVGIRGGIQNKEKLPSLAAVVVASNPRPSISKASESTKIHGIPPKIDKNEEKSSLARVVIASNPKPSISKRSESAKVHKPLVENDKNEEKSLKTSKLTFAESPAQKHDLKGDNKRSNVEADDVKAKSADDFQVDYAPPRTHPPHHNIKFN
ncbi:hypothetical protein ACH5RR_023861 [Cinchona calisaya]|uniref:Uncharacterized protein n=1 Tax=Cinchona calisaya TaxID=153742 RepID=A0ABD2ZBV4_9GENT